jgi:uracil-DNA glycosylase family 4
VAKGFFQAKGEEIATKMCRTEDCEACLLYKNAQAKLTFAGEGRLGILIVGPSPSAAEEDAKEYFHGRDYEFLKTALESIGISLEDDCYYLSALSCRPPYNRGAKRIEISSCGPRVWRYIQRLKPSVIICLGEDAFDTIIGPRISGRLLGTGYNKFYGSLIPDQELKTHLMVTYSVKELMSKRTYEDGASSKPLYERDKAVYRLWLQHLYDACSAYTKPVEVVDYARLCKPTQDIDQALEWIEEAMSWPAVAFDYETTGIKPHREGHRIVCASISNGSVSYAFPFFDDDTFQRAWKRLMESSVKKIAHNLSFEYLWTKEICGYWAKNVYWDTMLAAHCLHNLKPVGLKFCTYTEFGVIGYDESADPYLKSSEKDRNEFGDNSFNKIDKAPLADLLLYNALDSLFTYRLYERQMGRLEPFQKEGFDLLMESSLALTETTQYGCILNVERFHEVVGELEKKMDDAARAVMESDEVKLWDKDTEFNFNSPRQIGHLLYDILGIKPPFFTETGAPSTDAEALEKIKIPLVEKILTYRKYMKLLKTYIRQYSVESVDGLIHAWFHLHKVDTFRSSSAAPNIQNLPKRDDEAKTLITSLIRPRRGHRIISYDYKSLEVLINACHSGDKNLIAYASDPSKDMHRDSAADIFMLDPNAVPKPVRSAIKGAFVFASFYGSYYKQTAPDCWEVAKANGLLPHLAEKGITTYEQFEERVRIAEENYVDRTVPYA